MYVCMFMCVCVNIFVCIQEREGYMLVCVCACWYVCVLIYVECIYACVWNVCMCVCVRDREGKSSFCMIVDVCIFAGMFVRVCM